MDYIYEKLSKADDDVKEIFREYLLKKILLAAS